MTKLLMIFMFVFSYSAYGKSIKLNKKRKPTAVMQEYKEFEGSVKGDKIIRIVDAEAGAVCYIADRNGTAIHCISMSELPAQ